ncbi:tenascin-X-like isoform X1 [Branchiostoma lanceolatum]|uniref:tenascin-X-like isoform X1 n=1 Tax=Branchiostoma lanceolatum TaxID=7740 RepID=UPI0034561F0C
MGGYAAIVAVLLSTLLRGGNTVPVSGDSHNVANVSKPIISSASVNTPAGGMVFNHVYNINVPPVLCAGAGGQVTETSGTVEVGEGGEGAPFLANTFVPGGGGGGCCNNNGGSGSSGDLLNGETGSLVTALQESTEDLKKQLAELLKEFEQFKQSCGCVGAQGQPGVCDPACKYGKCENGRCVCDEGFTGDDCSERACPDNCKDRGDCVNGVCVCKPGFTGADCSQRACVPDCGDRGRCVNGVCQCEPGFEGPTCTSRSCPGNCMGRGVCVDGACQCESGFTGPDCSSTSCPNDCFGRGVCVDGVCQCEPGFVGEDCSAEISVPAPISGVFTRDITINSVFIGWVEEDYVDKYHLEYRRTNELNGWNEIEVFEPGYTVTGLASATEYQFRVSGANVKGRGEPSDVVEVSTKGPELFDPSPPREARGHSVDPYSVVVQWKAPVNGSDIVSGYRLIYQLGKDGIIQTADMNKPMNFYYVLQSVSPDTVYNMWIEPYSPGGPGPQSERFVVYTMATAGGGTVPRPETGTDKDSGEQDVTNPGAPLGVRGQPVDPYNIQLQWQPPTNPTDTISGYKLQYQKPGDSYPQTVDMGNPRDRTYILRGVSSDTQYNMWVTPYGPRGDGPQSQHLTVQTQPVEGPGTGPGTGTDGQPGGQDIVNPGAPIGVSGRPVDPYNIRLQWQPPTNPTDDIQGYKLQYQKPGDSSIRTVNMGNPRDRTYVLRGVSPDTQYNMWVTPYGPRGDGPQSQHLTVQTQPVEGPGTGTGTDGRPGGEDVVDPGAPLGVYGQPVGPYNIQLQWQPPTNPTDTITGYKLQYQKPGDSYPQTVDMGNPREPTYVLRGVSPDTQYNMWVTPYGPRGDGPQSQHLTVQTQPVEGPGTGPGTGTDGRPGGAESVNPGAPLGVSGQPVDPYNIRLQWQPPTNPTDTITGYKLQYQKPGDSYPQTVDMGNPRDHTYVLRGVSPDTQYNMWVTPYGPRGDGPQSQHLTVQTQPVEGPGTGPGTGTDGLPGGPEVVNPGAPLGVSGQPVDPYNIRLQWQPPTNPTDTITGYKLQYQKPGDSYPQTVDMGNPRDRTYVLRGVSPDTQYNMWVTPYGPRGDGPQSQHLTVQTQPVEGPGTGPGTGTDGQPGGQQEVNPGAPLGVSGQPVDPYNIRLQWKPPPNPTDTITGYKLQYQKPGDSYPQTVDMGNPRDRTYVLGGVSPDTQYNMWVTPYGPRGDGPQSQHLTVQTQPVEGPGTGPGTGTDGQPGGEVVNPGAPLAVGGHPVDPYNIRLQWRPPTNPTDDIHGYKLHYLKPGDNTLHTVDMGNPPDYAYTLRGVSPDSEYTMLVTPYGPEGDGPESEPFIVQTQSVGDKDGGAVVNPGAPRGVSGLPLDPYNVRVEWQPPPNPTDDIYGYKLQYQKPEDSYPQTVDMGNPSDSTYVLQGVSPDTQYNMWVTPYGPRGDGPQSQPFTVQTQDDPSAVVNPGAPQGVSGLPLDPYNVRVEWQPPSNPTDDIYGYKLQYQKPEDSSPQTVDMGNPPDSAYVLRGVSPDTQYNMWVTPYGPRGDGPQSQPFTVQTQDDPSGSTDMGDPGAPQGATGLPVDPYNIRVEWQAPTYPMDDISGYRLLYEKEGDTTRETVDMGNPPDLTYNLAGVSPDTEYNMWVMPYGPGGDGPQSQPFTVKTESEDLGSIAPKGAPGAASAVTRDASSLLVEWEAPTLPEGSPDLLGYRLFWRKVGEGEYQTVEVGPGELSYVLMDLNTFTEYEMYVIAFNANGDGPNSDTFTAMTAEGEDSGAPLGVAGEPVSPYSVRIQWRPPTNPPDPVMGYRLLYQRYGDDNQQLVDMGHPDDFSYTLRGLSPGSQYDVWVTPYGNRGDGPRSERVTLQTDAPGSGVPGAPVGLMGEAVDSQSITVRWNAPEMTMGVITGYKITYQPEGGNPAEALVPGSDLSHLLTGLTPYTVYTIYVVGLTSQGEGDRSDSVSVRTFEGAPARPVGVMANALDARSIQVTWQEPEVNRGIITAYNVYYQPASTTANQEPSKQTVSPYELFSLLGGLQPATEYVISVAAITSAGEGERSDKVTAQTRAGVPDAPSDFEAEAVDATSIQVSWEPPANTNGELQGYKILYRQAGTEDVSVAEVAPAAQYHLLTELQPFTVYLLALVAFTEGGEGETSREVTVQTDEDVPGPPQDVSVEPIDSTSGRVVWQPPAEPNGILQGYKVLYKDANAAEYTTREVESTEMSYVISDMIPGTEYVVAVSAFTGAGDGRPSGELRIQTEEGVPDVPTAVVAEGIDARSIRVSWQPPTESNGILQGYYIYYTPEGSDEEQRAEVGPTDTSYVASGLQPFTVYIITVSGFTAAGEGDRTEETRVQTLQGVPESPTGLGATPVDPRTIRVEWQPPQRPNGDIQGYNIYYRTTESEVDALQQAGAQDIFLTLTGLSPFTEYTIRVSALTGVGEGQTSDSVTVLTPAGAPSSPMEVEANAVDSQSIRINWQRPSEPNGNILGYNIFYNTEGENSNNQQTVGPDDTAYVLEGLRPATQYVITLNAFTEAGEGERTQERVVTTLTDVPGAPAGIDASPVDPTSIRVEWQAPSETGGTLVGYKIYYQLVGEDSPFTADVEPTETSYLLTDLQPFSEYLIWLVGYTEAGEGEATEQVTVQTPQGVPTEPLDVVAVPTGPTSATVNWQPPLANNGQLLGYKVYYKNTIDEKVTVAELSASELSHTNEDIEPMTEYLISVIAFTSIGEGPHSQEVPLRTEEGVPGSPIGVEGDPIDSTSILVRWQEPPDRNGILLGYYIHFLTVGSNGEQRGQVPASEDSYVITGLKPFTKYFVTISAVTGAGEGERSDGVTVETLESVPAAPTDLQATAVDARTIQAYWQQPQQTNGNLLGYRLFYQGYNDEDVTALEIPSTDTSWLLTGLQPATEYLIWVVAFTGSGDGERADQVIVQTSEGVPDAPRDIVASATNPTTIRVKWHRPRQTNGVLLGYKVFYKHTTDGELQAAVVPPNQLNHTNTDVEPMTEYVVTVSAFTSAGDGPESRPVTVRTQEGVPSSPFGLNAYALDTTSVSVSWQIPLDPNGVIEGYNLYYEAAGSEDEELMQVGPEEGVDSPYVLSGLQPYTLYSLEIAAVTGGGEGDRSDQLKVQTLEGVPSNPVRVAAFAVDPRTIRVDWRPPLKANGEIMGYNVFYGPSATDDVLSRTVDPMDNMVTLDGLQPFTEYTIILSAFTLVGGGDRSVPVVVRTPAGAPSRPLSVTADGQAPDTVEVAWQSPAENNGNLLGYYIYYQVVGSTETSQAETGPDETTYSISGLRPATEYIITLTAYTEGGESERSGEVLVSTLSGVPTTPLSVTADGQTPDSVVVTWQSPAETNGDLLGYYIYYQVVGSTETSRAEAGPDETTYSISGLRPATEYIITLTAYTEGGESERSGEVSVRTISGVPTTPLSVTADGQTPDSVVVTWQSPAENNGDLLGYYIYYQVVGSTETSRADTGPDETTYSISGLRPATEYIITLTAYTEGGESERSGEVSVRTMSGVPTTPLSVTAEGQAPDTITVTWQSPAENNGNLLGYYIYYQVVGSTETSRADTGPDETTYSISGLRPATEYIITLTAYTEGGESERSGEVLVSTLSGAPSTPLSVTAEENAPDAIMVTWEPPTQTNGELLGYYIYYQVVGGTETSRAEAGPDDVAYIISGLRPATEYIITLTAYTEGGESERSGEVLVSTLSGVPPTPSSVTAEGEAPDSIKVAWQSPALTNGNLGGFRIYYRVLGTSEKSRAETGPDEMMYSIRGLQPATDYVVTLSTQAEGGEIESERTSEIVVRTLSGAPSTPLGATAEGQAPDTIQVTWQAPTQTNGDLLGYYIYYQVVGSTEESQAEAGPDETTYSISGLRPATEYLITLTAYTEGGESERSGEVLVSTLSGAPSAPLSVSAQGQGPDTVIVAWQTPDETNGDLLGYYIYYQAVGSTETSRAEAGPNDATYIISGLRPATEYIITLTAYTEGGESERSGEALVSTLSGAPSTPLSVTAEGQAPDTITVTWQTPTETNGDLRGYYIYYQVVGSTEESQAEAGPDETTYSISGLRPATEYLITLTAYTEGGESERSGEVLVSTLSGAPSTPLGVTGEGQAPDAIRVTWQAPTDINGDLLGYYIYYSVFESEEMLKAEAGPADTTYLIGGLRPATEYEIYLTAYTVGGESEHSQSTFVRTLAGVPGAPASIRASSLGSEAIEVFWQPPPQSNGEILGYRLQYQIVGEESVSTQEVERYETFYLLRGLRPVTEYYIWLVAFTAAGEGERSEQVTVQTAEGVPGAPRDVQGQAVDPTTITVDWQPPLEINGVLLGYKVIYMPENAAEFSAVELGPAELSTMLLDLEPDTTYSIVVLAFTAAGDGDESEEILVGTMQGVPGPPTDLSAVERTSDSVKLSWQAPEGDIEGYRVFYSLAGSDTEETVDTRSPDASWSLSGLQSFGEYSISVLAYNSAGDGERSETITVQTEEGVPGAPREVQGLAIDSTTIELQWMPPSPDEQNGVIKGYKILYKKVGEEGENEEDAGLLDLMYTLSDLEKWTEYNIWVSAYTSAGDGLRSPVIVVRTGEDVPGPPIGIEARPGDDSASVLVQWQQPIVQNGVIVGYKILYQKSGEEDVEVTDIGSPQVAFTLSGLDWNDYNVWVVAYTGAGDGDRSDPVLVRPAEGVPGPPSAVFASPLDFDTMEVRWQPPLYIYGQLLGYKVLYRSVNEIENQVVVTPTTEPSFTLPGLDADTIYIISVVAYTMAGDGPRSNEFVVRTLEGVPGPAQSLSGLVWDSQSVQLRWQPPYNAYGQIRGYKVFYQRMGQITPSTEDTQSTGLVHKLSGLKKWTEYIISVAAYTSRGDGMKSNQIIIRTMQDVPGAPEDVQGIAQGSNALRVTWQPPTDRNGVIQGYKVYYARMGTEDYIEIDTQNTELSFELSELRPWTSYTFSVSAYTSVGEGPQSSKVTTRTEEDVPTVGPGGLNAEAVDAESIRVSWIRISDAEAGGALQGYQVFYQAITADGALEISDAQIYKVEGADTLEATLTGLEAGTRYAITVSGYTSSGTGIRADLVEATTQTGTDEGPAVGPGGIPYPNPSDCGQVVANGESESGPFTVYPTDGSEPIEVWCDMETDGGGWIVFQRRQDGSVDFWRRWREYRAGFGENTGEFWLGNDNIHRLSNQGEYQLRIDLGDGADAVYGEWDNFKLGSESDLYKLIIGEYSGTSGDSLTYHNNRPFSTRDKDNDVALSHCAFAYHGAWWYKNCHRSNLNGQYGDNTHSQGVNWYHWKGHEKSVPFVEMKMRSMDFKTKYARAE